VPDPADLPVTEGGEDVVPEIAGDCRRRRVGVDLRGSPVLCDVGELPLGVGGVDPVAPRHVGPVVARNRSASTFFVNSFARWRPSGSRYRACQATVPSWRSFLRGFLVAMDLLPQPATLAGRR
jgi:hypothetical protein